MKTLIAIAVALASFATANSQWPTFHGNNQRSGLSPAIGPANASILWTYDLNGPMINSPAVAPDGTIYTGSVWFESMQPTAYISAINPNGTLKWRFETGFFDDQSPSSPAIGPEGNVYVGTANNVFFALNSNGVEVWRYQTLDQILTHPLVAPNGIVYAKMDGFVFAFSPTGQVQWQFPIGSNTPGSPALAADGTIYVPGADGLYAINPNGTLRWRFAGPDSFSSPAVAADGKIIYASGSLFGINPNGSLAWQSFDGIAPYSAPTIDAAGNIYIIQDWEFRKYSAGGQLIWEREFLYDINRLESAWTAPIVDAANRLYFGLGTGKRWALASAKGLVAYDTNGNKLYNLLLPETPSTSSPAMGADGTIYIGCLDGKLYAIGQPWQVVSPTSFTVQPGVIQSGGLPQLLQADDQLLVTRPGITFSTSQRPIVVATEGTAPVGTFTAMQVVVESRSTSASVRQWIDLYNFATSQWDQLETRMTSVLDHRSVLSVTTPGQYIEPVTRKIRTRISYKAEGPVFVYPWRASIDQAIWNIR